MQQAMARIQSLAPPEMKYQLTLVEKDEVVSIESVLQGRGRKSGAAPTRRSAISNYAEIITSEEATQRILQKENKELQEKRSKRKSAMNSTKQKVKKVIKYNTEEESSSESEVPHDISLDDSSDLTLDEIIGKSDSDDAETDGGKKYTFVRGH